MRKKLFRFLYLTVVCSCRRAAFGTGGQDHAGRTKDGRRITAAQLSNYLYFVASDAMGGRDTPSHGLDMTAEFLKMNLDDGALSRRATTAHFFRRSPLTRESRRPGQDDS